MIHRLLELCLDSVRDSRSFVFCWCLVQQLTTLGFGEFTGTTSVTTEVPARGGTQRHNRVTTCRGSGECVSESRSHKAVEDNMWC